ncbi:type III restriction enzyme, res subunit (macronuclear) [Tetrahymena thermophila SB210]|uniref:Type III restriction enzyme, res subunit n=1 Tax=Tetrahymena thermophila (strain SB210) TaxID=312017 RepID=I7MMW7_TETTS|nr:type III restriction enzyme, res subunit [Tetrahymena thermophila SB210]EAS07110.2 type III restriction enzyme, res subunit [Tetrahymena thermophila SB210]|eukprot:XP_001027352.2 type III restriction enzyme, res subunit [Tetrahymena thermophila SB210]
MVSKISQQNYYQYRDNNHFRRILNQFNILLLFLLLANIKVFPILSTALKPSFGLANRLPFDLAKCKINPYILGFSLTYRQQFGFANVALPSFNYNIHEKIKKALESQNIFTPSPIQDLAIPALLNQNHNNFFLAAQTGTGKTLAYLIPIISQFKKLEEANHNQRLTTPNRPSIIIIVPTKELANQLEDECKKLIHFAKFTCLGVNNSKVFMREKKALDEGVDVLIGTPDRIERHREKGNLFLSNVSYFVVDEADTFLDSGYKEVIETYIKTITHRQEQIKEGNYSKNIPKMIFVSATYTGQLRLLFESSFDNFKKIKLIIDKKTHMNLQHIEHEFIHCQGIDKKEPITKLLKEIMPKAQKQDGSIMIFCNSIPSCRSLDYTLSEEGYDVVSFHGDIPKRLRIQNFDRFKSRESKIMICTDLASRGLDFPFLTHVVNYDFPITTSDYLHRAGRTGRAGRKGSVISLYHNKDNNIINELKKSHDNKIPVNIKGSQYATINKEVLQRLKQKSEESSELNKYEQLKQKLIEDSKKAQLIPYVPKSYIEFKSNYENGKLITAAKKGNSDLKKQLKNYIPEINRDKEQLKELESQVKGVKKKYKLLNQNRFKDLKGRIRALKRNIQVKQLKEKGQLHVLRKHKLIESNLKRQTRVRKQKAREQYAPKK